MTCLAPCMYSELPQTHKLTIWNGMRPRVLVQNRHTRELISAQKMSLAQQQRPESPTVTLTCHRCKYKVHKLHQRYILAEDAPCQVSCRRRLRSLLLCLCDAFGAFFPVAKSNRLEANLHYSWHPSTPGYRDRCKSWRHLYTFLRSDMGRSHIRLCLKWVNESVN